MTGLTVLTGALIISGVIVVIAALMSFLERDYEGTVYTKHDPPTRQDHERIVHNAKRGG